MEKPLKQFLEQWEEMQQEVADLKNEVKELRETISRLDETEKRRITRRKIQKLYEERKFRLAKTTSD